MKQSLDFQESNLFILHVRENWTPDDVVPVAGKAEEYAGDKDVIRYLIDPGQTVDIPPAAREMITMRARKDIVIEKADVFGARTRIRFPGTLVLKIASSLKEFKSGNIRFSRFR